MSNVYGYFIYFQLFKLETRPETVEVYFSQAYHKACRSIQGIVGKEPQNPGAMPSKVGLKAVASAAAAGLATASVSDVADNILKFPTIPQMPKIELSENVPKNIVQIFQQENMAVIILLDLMCTSAKSWDVCNHLIDTIKSHQLSQPQSSGGETSVQNLEPKSQVAVSKQRVNKIKTLPDAIAQIQRLLQLGAEDQIPSKEQTKLAKTFQKSVQYFLSHATHSLSADKSKQCAMLNQNLSRYVERVEEAFFIIKTKGHVTTVRSEDRQRLGSMGPQSPRSEARQRFDSTGPQSPRSESRQRLGSMGPQSPISGSKLDKPSIHHYMKQLIHTLEKEVPAGGVVSLISR